jgi:aryl-alcohol dehydrogenase-like predicted oxidoreductase
MQSAHLGRTGLQVSRLCLGTMNFGPYTEESESWSIMDHALEAGINFFDTANVYGWKLGEGVTEAIVGRWFAQGGNRREHVVLATKVFGKMGEGLNQGRLSAYHIRQACEDSLRRLHTDHIDLYQMHHVDRDTPWEEIWQAMENLVAQGKVLYIGSSNFAGWQLAQAQETAARRHFMGLVSEQSLYNLTERSIELEVIPACQSYGLGLIPWSPLAAGLLAGQQTGSGKAGRRQQDDVLERASKLEMQLGRYLAYARRLEIEPAELALAWLLHRPAVTAPIIGPRTPAHLDSALHAAELEIGDEVMQELDAIWPGPGGPAPEAYAW